MVFLKALAVKGVNVNQYKETPFIDVFYEHYRKVATVGLITVSLMLLIRPYSQEANGLVIGLIVAFILLFGSLLYFIPLAKLIYKFSEMREVSAMCLLTGMLLFDGFVIKMIIASGV